MTKKMYKKPQTEKVPLAPEQETLQRLNVGSKAKELPQEP